MLQDKTVVLTGVGPGLGRAVAPVVLREGGNVVLGARTASRLKEIAIDLDPEGNRVAYQATDILEPDQCSALAQLAMERFGGVDAAVQIAAGEVMGGVRRTTDADWAAMLTGNVVGTAHVVAAIAEVMGDGGGSIVLMGSQTFAVSSMAGQQVAYAASKGALHSAMFHMAAEFGRRKIRVNTVVPSWMWGPTVKQFVAGQAKRRDITEEAVVAEITENMPLGEIPTVEDVAETVSFLCSDRARMITGQTLFVNAGNHMT
jgi:NAD(P)-dependent dehydrogenase (short-subunit alcohol dehydrogenase family)